MSEIVVTEKLSSRTKEDKMSERMSKLILFNDDVNTFDHVIKSLIEVCGHTAEQAEQCALIAHLKGKCTVKTGSKDDLLPCMKSLNDRMLNSIVIS